LFSERGTLNTPSKMTVSSLQKGGNIVEIEGGSKVSNQNLDMSCD
jgi:hypothetical protein